MMLTRLIPFTSSRSPPHRHPRPSPCALLVAAMLLSLLLLPSCCLASAAAPPLVSGGGQEPSPADVSQAADDPQSDLQPSKPVASADSPSPAAAADAGAPDASAPPVHRASRPASRSPPLAPVLSGSAFSAPLPTSADVSPAAVPVPARQQTVTTSRKSTATVVHGPWRLSQHESASPPAASPPPPSPPAAPADGAASDAAVEAPSSLSPPAADAVPETGSAEACLSESDVVKQKAELKARLLSIMDAYIAVWKLEERGEEETAILYDSKKQELKEMLKVRKDEILAKACPASSPAAASTRRLLGLEEDDWFDQEEEEAAVLFTPAQSAHQDELQLSSAAQEEEEDRGVMARIIAGGSHRSRSSDELPADDDAQLFDASIHPYHAPAPSAFTELTQRDIASRHAQAAAASSRQSRTGDVDEFGFVASISPARFTPTPPGQRSQRDLDEDYEEERRRRRERLKAMRVQQQPPAAAAADDDDVGGGQFVASISPMAPQRSSLVFEEEAEQRLYVASISPPARRSQSEPRRGDFGDDEWSDSSRQSDGRSGSRQRLEAIAIASRSRNQQTL